MPDIFNNSPLSSFAISHQQIPSILGSNQTVQNYINTDFNNMMANSNLSLQKIVPELNKTLNNSKSSINGNVWSTVGKVTDIVGSFMPQKSEYNGAKGNITQSMDSIYDGISNMAMSIPGWGTLVGGIMKGNALLGKGINALGGGTDGMCVCAGTKVYKSDGSIVNIEDLKQEDGIIGWRESTKQIVPQTIHDIIEPRQKECLEIVTKAGYSIKCSIDHPILSDNNSKAKSHTINGRRVAYREWKFRRADELKVGDFIGVANNIDYWGDIQVPKAYLIGLLIGNGTYTNGSSCRLISTDPDTWNYIESNNLGVINHCDDSRADKYQTEIRTYRIIDGMTLMREAGLVYQSGKEKTLPINLGQYNKNSVCNLIAGLYDTDGSISINKEKNSWSITLYQSNKSLLDQVREQLHKLGIFASISTRKAAKYQLGGKVINSNESYRLEIGDIASAIKFYQLIPLNISYKRDNLIEIYNLVKDKKVQEHPELSGAKQFKILSITPIGIQTVYNLQADNDHTYLANGIITHNTSTDAILDSSFLSLTPLGLVNGFGGKKANTITKDNEAFAQVGSSYTGSNYLVDRALEKSGKKYGLFSSGARNKANKQINEARRQQDIITDISDNSLDRSNLLTSMSAIRGNLRQFNMQGGYNQKAIRVGKKGMLLEKAQNILKGKKPSYKVWVKDVNPKYLFKNYDLETAYKYLPFEQLQKWKFAVNSKDPNYYLNYKDKNGNYVYHLNSVAPIPETEDYIFLKKGKESENPEVHFETDTYYNNTNGLKNTYDIVYEGDRYYYRKKKISSHKNGGSIIKPVFETVINLVNPLDIPEFQNGGSINVIPEGALHARKHNLDIDGITKKGIPVVSEDDNGNIEQQAEVEREEVILRLEVTQKLEELEKKYYNEETSQKEKDECALEAGKLLTKELLHNTKDNAGLL